MAYFTFNLLLGFGFLPRIEEIEERSPTHMIFDDKKSVIIMKNTGANEYTPHYIWDAKGRRYDPGKLSVDERFDTDSIEQLIDLVHESDEGHSKRAA